MNTFSKIFMPLVFLFLSGGILAQPCVPDGIVVTEACDWNAGESLWETAVDVSVSINLTCALTEVCFSRAGDGVYDCVDVSALNLVDGDTYHLSLPGAGIYQIWTATPSGTSSIEEIQVNCYDETFDCENPYAVNYDAAASNPDELACIYDTYVCDCAGTSHSMGVLTFLGDGELEDESGGKTWNENPVHLRCNVWGFDCGDAGINFDPYGVCEGNLPPNNGCSSPGCSPLTIAISSAPCQTGPYGLESVISMTFGASDGCSISELHYQVNSGTWNTVDLSADGGFSNGDVYLLEGAEPSATYQCYTTTSSGAVSPYFTFQNGELCSTPTDFCDCDGNTWPESFSSYIGNGTNNDGVTPENGFYINLNCPAWSYDCGDGAGNVDPFGVCEGNFPPGRGCQEYSFGCTDDTACNFDPTAVTDDGTCDYSCQGCTDPLSCNFDNEATLDDGSCIYDCQGCTDPVACNYSNIAIIEDGSCEYNCQGCTDAGACNYDAGATIDDGSCTYGCAGCTDDTACNYNPSSTIDDGSCDFSCLGCTDSGACNYEVSATIDDGSCDYTCIGCTDNFACNYEPTATIDDGSCVYNCFGCTNVTACNYDPFALLDDGSCTFDCNGCTDDTACNYSASALNDDGSCDYSCLGCMDNLACNYNVSATMDDGSCDYDCQGCMDENACNYDPSATIDSGACDFDCLGCTDVSSCNFDVTATVDDGSCNYDCLGCTDEDACNFDATATLDNGSCFYPQEFSNCAGQCNNDEDNDGVCDELEIEGCTYMEACNFNPVATEEDGSCEFSSCAGCTYPEASNYDENAQFDNGSCEFGTFNPCLGDMNSDGIIGVNDLIMLLQAYGSICE